jgi:hypothetical protein
VIGTRHLSAIAPIRGKISIYAQTIEKMNGFGESGSLTLTLKAAYLETAFLFYTVVFLGRPEDGFLATGFADLTGLSAVFISVISFFSVSAICLSRSDRLKRSFSKETIICSGFAIKDLLIIISINIGKS